MLLVTINHKDLKKNCKYSQKISRYLHCAWVHRRRATTVEVEEIEFPRWRPWRSIPITSDRPRLRRIRIPYCHGRCDLPYRKTKTFHSNRFVDCATDDTSENTRDSYHHFKDCDIVRAYTYYYRNTISD